MIDLYTKTVLTVIALALCVIATRGLAIFDPASAQGRACGDSPIQPCYVTGTVSVDHVGGIVVVSGSVAVARTVAVVNEVKIDTGMLGLPVRVQR